MRIAIFLSLYVSSFTPKQIYLPYKCNFGITAEPVFKHHPEAEEKKVSRKDVELANGFLRQWFV